MDPELGLPKRPKNRSLGWVGDTNMFFMRLFCCIEPAFRLLVTSAAHALSIRAVD
jgi:hypothetical protein